MLSEEDKEKYFFKDWTDEDENDELVECNEKTCKNCPYNINKKCNYLDMTYKELG